MSSEQEMRDIIERLARIEEKLEGRNFQYRLHSERIQKLEETVGRQNFIAAVLGALAGGVVLMIQWVSGRSV